MPPRAGVTVDRIVDVAAMLADRDGYDTLTIARIAEELGVRSPSLYNHVEGIDDIRRLLTVRAFDELGSVLQRSGVGRSRDDAVRATARAFRTFALAHPGMYATTVPSSEIADDDIRQAGTRAVEVVLAILRGYELDEDAAIHAARSLRAAVHGFVSLELAGGFGLEQPTGETFDWMVALLVDGFARQGSPLQDASPAPGT